MSTKPTTKATARKATKALKPTADTVEQAEYEEALETIEDAVQQVVATFGVTVQRARLKGIRALLYRSLVDHMQAGTLDDLIARSIEGAPHLPLGWTVNAPKRAPKPERAPKAAPAATEKPKAAPKKAAATRKPRTSKGSTVATEEGVVIAEQRHVDLTVHEADPNKANGCTCGQHYGSKAALSRHLNVSNKGAAAGTKGAEAGK